MTKKELERLAELEKRTKEIAVEFGLLTTDILFEVVPAQRVLEGMSYMFPVNFSHWSFGRNYEKNRTIYEHTGHGIPYEQVWNFDIPRAFLVETNPFALNALIVAHVYGHVDFFLASRYCQHGRTMSYVAEEAHNAATRFAKYEEKYGKRVVEKVIDAGMSVMWHQNPDPFFEEQDEEEVREQLLAFERAKLERFKDIKSEFRKPETKQEIEKIEHRLEWLSSKTPPEPTYDILKYITAKSPKPLKPWMVDVLTVLRNQARALSPNMRTKMLNEGWATYWHVRIMRRLFEEGALTPEEHGIFNDFHSGVTEERKISFNWYRIGLSVLENVEERWNKGQFGREYDEERSHAKRLSWDTAANLGKQKIFEIRSHYTDRMAVEELFTDEFIHEQQLYFWIGINDGDSIVYVVAEDDPAVIRQEIKSMMTTYGTPIIRVGDGNYEGNSHLYLKHVFNGYDLDSRYRDHTLANILYLWGRKVYLETVIDGKDALVSCEFEKKQPKIKIKQ
ncbi:MAG TPA: SpoVR family protein [Candidatus Paceibacterota bacterium]|nr:SpoVR family protein [Candidatus Paceibacterota bacterium]